MAKGLILEVQENKTLRRRKVTLWAEWLYAIKEFHAWYRLRGLFTNLEKSLGLVVDERFAIPLSPYKDERYTKEEILARIDDERNSDQAFNFMKNQAVRQGHTNVIAWTVSIAVTGSLLAFIILALLIASGKIQL